MKKDKLKQYTVEKAYDLNYSVFLFVDGNMVKYRTMTYEEVMGYTAALEDEGYEEAFYLPKYEKEMMAAEEEYNYAKVNLEKAVASPLKVNNSEVGYLERLMD